MHRSSRGSNLRRRAIKRFDPARKRREREMCRLSENNPYVRGPVNNQPIIRNIKLSGCLLRYSLARREKFAKKKQVFLNFSKPRPSARKLRTYLFRRTIDSLIRRKYFVLLNKLFVERKKEYIFCKLKNIYHQVWHVLSFFSIRTLSATYFSLERKSYFF